MKGVLPDPIASHFVVVGGRRFPPKQVIGLVTGLDRADFTSHQARRVLMRLGFPVGRRTGEPEPEGPHEFAEPSAQVSAAESLRPLAGQWVAVKGYEILVAADAPGEVVGWLSAHDRQADSMFRVPEDDLAVTGLAPW